MQGSGAGASISDPNATIIYANPSPQDKLAAWHTKINAIRGNDPFLANEAPGVMVFGDVPGSGFVLDPAPASKPLVDGFMIFGAVQGGGVCAYNQSHHLVISNNRIRANQGSYGGGITLGQPDIGTGVLSNENITIQYNRISGNGGVFGAGGIDITNGSDNYKVMRNIIIGNLSRWNGGGIAHDGFSNNGSIANNQITFNEVFFGAAVGGDGGGIYIGGELANGAAPGALGEGAGNVTVNANLIQGNLSGSGSGGGIRVQWFNGQDVNTTPYSLNIFNNMIVNNVAGLAGGAIALQDVSQSNIINNTIAHNDSTATAANAFPAGSLDSTPQGAGIVSSAHSGALADATGQMYSNPVLRNNILWQNRSFYNEHTLNAGAGGLAPNPAMPVWDLQVSGVAGLLNPQNCILSDLTGYGPSNISANPGFLGGYLNQLFSSTVLDEGGNAITVRFTPVKPSGNYHINIGSPAIDLGTGPLAFAELAMDFDGQARPNPGGGIDSGADEFYLMANYVISGSVRTPVGLPIAGVTITLSGAANVTTTTDTTGNYSFAGLANGAYTVTPAFAGYVFTPTNRAVTISGANITGQNFTGTPISSNLYDFRCRCNRWRYADSRGHRDPDRRCKCDDYDKCIRELQLCRSGKRCIYGDAGFCRVCIHTDEQGGNDKRGEYNRPELHRHTHSSNLYDFRCCCNRWRYADSRGHRDTDRRCKCDDYDKCNGNYSFAGLANGAYTVTPAFAGYVFTPTNRAVTISGANITGQNFTGTPTAGVYSISGRVKDSRGRSIAGITIRLAGIVNRTAITDTNGNYAFTGLAPGSYVVTPSMTGLAFSPVSRNITITNASFTGQDFEGRISAF